MQMRMMRPIPSDSFAPLSQFDTVFLLLKGAHIRFEARYARNAPSWKPRIPPQLCTKSQFRRFIRHSRFGKLDLTA